MLPIQPSYSPWVGRGSSLACAMTRRMEIELTSSREDGNWTWRAAGALQPRGVIASSMLSGAPRVGEVIRVEADFEIDGITIIAVLPNKTRTKEPELLEILPAAPGSFEPITTSLVGKGERRGRGRDSWDGGGRGGAGEGRAAARPRTEGGPSRGAGGERGPRREPQTRESASTERRPPRPRAETSAPTGDAPRAPRPARTERPARPERPTRTRPPRLVLGTAHRDELLSTFPPEQRPIAVQLAQGGLAAVRRTLAEEQTAARAAGRTVENSDAIVAVAEQMLPGIRQAVWLDRAEAVFAALGTITLRDLRSTVVGAAPRDDAGRELLSKLREALNERVGKLRTAWESEIAKALDEARVLQALRLSARPPEPTTRFPAALVERLVAAAGAALDDSAPKERWLALLEAASESPVRRSIHPAGIPDVTDPAVRQAATEAAGRIPALAKLLGLAMPPPPRPAAQRPLPPRPPRVAGTPRRAEAPVTVATVATTAATAPQDQEPLSAESGDETAAPEPGAVEVALTAGTIPAKEDDEVDGATDGPRSSESPQSSNEDPAATAD